MSFVLCDFSSFTPDEWEAYSSENIAKAERERKASVALRAEINGILMQTYVDLRNIFETVNNEFTKRIEETTIAKKSLEKELTKVKYLLWVLSFFALSILASSKKETLDSFEGQDWQSTRIWCFFVEEQSPGIECSRLKTLEWNSWLR